MLPAAHRLTRREDFATAVRRGRRAARAAVVVHLAVRAGADSAAEPPAPLVGFIVGRSVGGAVVRHRVQRRLRHLMRDRIDVLPAGALVAVRALPAAAGAPSVALADDLDAALRTAIRRLAHPDPPARSGSSVPATAGGRR